MSESGSYWVLGVDGDGSAPSRGARTAVADVRRRLRDAILAGELLPGELVTSVEVAERFGVSRTPAREALRMLQEEGFLSGESNQRLRVVQWSPDELEAVFAERIMLTVLCTRVTVPRLTPDEIGHMEQLVERMRSARESGNSAEWRAADVAFHSMHMHRASPALREDVSRLYERASMFRALWLENRGQHVHFATDDHPAILDACTDRDGDRAALVAARHLTRVALTLMIEMNPGRDSLVIREALRLAGGGDSEEPLPWVRPSGTDPASLSDIPHRRATQ
jgi:DNA-binding GntR family transcriptional regulator